MNHPARTISGGRRIARPRRRNNKDQEEKKFNFFLEKNQALPVESKIIKITLNDGSQDHPLEFTQNPKYIKSCNVFYVAIPKLEIQPSSPSDTDSSNNKFVRLHNKKAEKKFRAQMIKNGVPSSPQFQDVTVTFDLIREIWIQNRAELFRVPGGYLIFGQLELQNRQQEAAKEQFDQQIQKLNLEDFSEDGEEPPDLEDEEEKPPEEEKLPEGIKKDDLDLLLSQVKNCTREQAINALRSNNGDIVNSIMSLS